MTKRKDRVTDPAEAWLRDRDPEYAKRSREWRPPQTDAMEHQGSRRKMHGTMSDLVPLLESHRGLDDVLSGEPRDGKLLMIPPKHGVPAVLGSGNYRRRAAAFDEHNEYDLNEVKDNKP